MQLCAETDVDRAIEELKIALPITALQNIIQVRERQHKPRAELRHHLRIMRAIQLIKEAAR